MIAKYANPEKDRKIVCSSYKKAIGEGGDLALFYRKWLEQIRDIMRNNNEWNDNVFNTLGRIPPLMPIDWASISTKDFEDRVNNMLFNNYPVDRDCNRDDYKISPSMVSVYWSLVKNGYLPSQIEFINAVINTCVNKIGRASV